MKIAFGVMFGALLALQAAPGEARVSGPPIALGLRTSFHDLGRLASGAPIALGFSLKYHHDAELATLIRAQSTPGSRAYGRFLSPAQFREYFAPTQAEYAGFVKSLQASGYVVTRTSPSRTFVDARGDVALVERDFATSLHRVALAGGVRGFANVSPAYLPERFKPIVFSVSGLYGLPIAHTANLLGQGKAGLAPARHGPFFGPDGGFGPAVFARAYDAPILHGTSQIPYDGTGKTVATVIDSDFADSDLATYLAYFHVKRTGPAVDRIPVDGGVNSNFDVVEATLDVETIGGTSPGAGILVYEIPQLNDVNIEDAYSRIVSDGTADVVNSSFGGCEASQLPGAPQAEDHIAQQGNAEGITFAASTGDSGAAAFGCDPNAIAVEAPASAPHFTALGGTALAITPNVEYATEQGWWQYDLQLQQYFGGGGGVSTIFPVPAFQSGIKNVLSTGRNIPDVSLSGALFSGQSFYLDGSWIYGPAGGTSLASAMFSAFISQMSQVAKHRFGNVNEAIYQDFRSGGYGRPGDLRFHDATTGGNPTWPAAIGYDRSTGIGSLNFWHFARTLK